MRTVIPVYSITMGLAMIAMWAFFWSTGAIPDMLTKPWEITMHLTAEFTTAALLIISGVGMLFGLLWAQRVNVFASGMLVYTLIQSPGYYLQRNALIFVVMCAVSFVLTVSLSPAFKPVPKKVLVQTPVAETPLAVRHNRRTAAHRHDSRSVGSAE